MNSTPSNGQAPGRRQRLPPSAAGTPSVTKVAPAKKITFFKRGDPRCAGVRVAVHQRAFKTFGALMDELSGRMPLSFGVRSVTTPRGLHSLSTLEQLQDGGCYLCSDRKPPKTPSGPGRPPGSSSSALQSWGLTGGRETLGSSPRKGATAPRRVTLVKNGDPRSRRGTVLSHRNTRSLAAFLSRASDLLRFPVKQLYTTSGEKVDCLQALLHSPSVLVCVGNEAFRPLEVDDAGETRTGTVSGLTSQSKNGRWGPKAKQSEIHLRSRSGGKPPPSSSLSAKSGDHPPSGHPACTGPAPHSHPGDVPTRPGPLVAGDNVEKNVHVNEDGSLSVEMKVRFQLLGEDALLWSQRLGWAGARSAVPGDAGPPCRRPEGRPCGSVESGAPPGCRGAFGTDRQPGPSYDIWRNPLCVPREGQPAPRRTWVPTQRAHCGYYRRQGTRGPESIGPASSAANADTSETDSCDPGALESGGDSRGPCPGSASAAQSRVQQEAGQGPCTEGRGPRGLLGPRTRGVARAFSDSSASAGPPGETGKGGGQHPACPRRAAASRGKATQARSPRAAALSPSSGSHKDLRAEKCGPGARCQQPRSRLPPRSLDYARSWGAEGGSAPPPASAPAPPSLPALHRAARRGRARRCPAHRPAALPAPRPPARRRASLGGTTPGSPQNPPRAGGQAPGGPRPPALGSQDLAVAASDSDGASGSHRPRAASEEPAGQTKCGGHSSAPTRGAGSLGDEAGSTPEPPSSPSSSPSSVLLDGCPGGGESRAPPSGRCSRTEAGPAWGDPTQAASSPFSQACWGRRSYVPTPPGQPPRAQARPSSCGADGGAGPGRGRPRTCPRAPEAPQAREEDPGAGPGRLPHSSPDAIIRGWLDDIPEAPVLMGYGALGEPPGAGGGGPEGLGAEEGPGDDAPSLKGSVGLAGARRPSEGEPAEALPAGSPTGPEPEAAPHPGKAPGEASEPQEGAGAGGRAGGSPWALPGRAAAPAQVVKALLGVGRDRPSSLPEVSSAAARRLGRAAGALVACLARLHFFHEDRGAPAGKARRPGSSGCPELLSELSPALWPRGGLARGRGDAGVGVLASPQALPGTEGFTPTSSSGVDVSSGSGGSGGSGEGSGPCATEPPPKASHGPDPGTLRCPQDLGAPPPRFPTSAPHLQEPGRDGGRQEPGPGPEEARAERTEGGGGAEEERALQQGAPGARSGDAEGSPEDAGVPEEEAGGGPEGPAEPPEGSSGPDSRGRQGPRGSPGQAAPEGPSGGAPMGPASGRESTAPARGGSRDPDPRWVSQLLRKMEKAFLAHLAEAAGELRARWDLQDGGGLDPVVAELTRDVGLRLHASTERELRKVRSRAGRTAPARAVPAPPPAALPAQASLQTERRRRLWGLHNLSGFPEPGHGGGLLPPAREDGPAPGAGLGREAAGEDAFCPCHACARKPAALPPPPSTAGTAGAPIRKAFDLREILQKKKGGGAEPSPEAVQGVGGARVLGKGEGGEDSQRPLGKEDPQPQEAGGAEYPEREAAAPSALELDGVTEQGGPRGRGSEEGAAVEAEGGQAQGGCEAREEGQAEAEDGHEGKGKSGSLVDPGTRGEASRRSSLNQEGRPTPPAPQSPSPPTPSATRGCPVAEPPGDRSPASRQGASADPGCPDVGARGAPRAEGKTTTMYPESSTSEQEEAASDPGVPVQGAEGDDDVGGDERASGSFSRTHAGDRAERFGRDDLDF